MTDRKKKSLLEGGPRDALGEGAERLDKLIEGVKLQQAENPEPGKAGETNPLRLVSPDEIWAARFQSVSIGPETSRSAMAGPSPLPRSYLAGQMLADGAARLRASEIVPKPLAAGLGERIGRPVKPRKSLLGRIFGRS